MKPLTLVGVPCLSGAPWTFDHFDSLAPYPLHTLRLRDDRTTVDAHADDLLAAVEGKEPYVLMGDSFGAQVALAAAVRRPPGLRGLVLSGGFAASPVTDPLALMKIKAARVLPGPLYRQVVLRLHARALASPFDHEGDTGWTERDSVALFRDNTSWRAYVARTRAALGADFRDRLGTVTVPTLILTPGHDRLIGPDAARILREGIPDAREVVLERTGHMFRLSHPRRYATAIRPFVDALAEPVRQAA